MLQFEYVCDGTESILDVIEWVMIIVEWIWIVYCDEGYQKM